MQVICAICNTTFENNSTHFRKYCSDECATEGKRIAADKYVKTHKDKIQEKRNKLKKIAVCLGCGDILPNAKQTRCLNCLLRDYKYHYCETAYSRLHSRGYDKETIEYEIKERNI